MILYFHIDQHHDAKLLTPVMAVASCWGHYIMTGRFEEFLDHDSMPGNKAIVMASDYDHPAHIRGINLVRRSGSIPSFSIQHGFPIYEKYPVVGLATYRILWSDAHKEFFKADNMAVGGNPALDWWRHTRSVRARLARLEPANGLGMAKKKLLFLPCMRQEAVGHGLDAPRDPQKRAKWYWDELTRLIPDYNNYDIVIKPHPMDYLDRGRMMAYELLSAPSNCTLIRTMEHSIYHVFADVDCVIGTSSALLEALDLGIPVIPIGLNNVFTDGAIWYQPYADNIVKYQSDFPGRASQRIMSIISSVVEKENK